MAGTQRRSCPAGPPMNNTVQQMLERTRCLLLASPLVLSGCAGFSSDGGMDFVMASARSDIDKQVVVVRTDEDAAAARAATDRLLKRPLTADSAVQIALSTTRSAGRLQRARHRRSAMVQAACRRIRRFRSSGYRARGSSRSRGGLSAIFLRLRRCRRARRSRPTASGRRSCAPPRRRCASRPKPGAPITAPSRRGERDRRAGAGEIAAETATQLAARLGETGAMNKLDQAREQVFYAEITAQLATARQRSDASASA